MAISKHQYIPTLSYCDCESLLLKAFVYFNTRFDLLDVGTGTCHLSIKKLNGTLPKTPKYVAIELLDTQVGEFSGSCWRFLGILMLDVKIPSYLFVSFSPPVGLDLVLQGLGCSELEHRHALLVSLW